jgi:hypothetical protein
VTTEQNGETGSHYDTPAYYDNIIPTKGSDNIQFTMFMSEIECD